jgi:hypothetical protein
MTAKQTLSPLQLVSACLRDLLETQEIVTSVKKRFLSFFVGLGIEPSAICLSYTSGPLAFGVFFRSGLMLILLGLTSNLVAGTSGMHYHTQTFVFVFVFACAGN